MRYIRLYLYFLQFSFSKALEFRLDFTFKIFMDILFYVVNLSFFKILYLHTPLIAGWNESQIYVFVCSYLLIDAFHMSVFSSNMWWLPILINKGDLDYYLLKPVSPLFFLSLRDFSANSFINLLIAISLFITSLLNLETSHSIFDYIFYFLLILNGALLYYLIQLFFIIPVFWTQSSRGFNDLFYSLGISIERPDKIYKGWLKVLFTMILPFGLVASFPARFFFDQINTDFIFHMIFVTGIFWFSVMVFWQKGLKAYSSASS